MGELVIQIKRKDSKFICERCEQFQILKLFTVIFLHILSVCELQILGQMNQSM